MQTDGQTEMTDLIGGVSDCANAPKNDLQPVMPILVYLSVPSKQGCLIRNNQYHVMKGWTYGGVYASIKYFLTIIFTLTVVNLNF